LITNSTFIQCERPSVGSLALYEFFQSRLNLKALGLCSSSDETLRLLDQKKPDLLICNPDLGQGAPSGIELCLETKRRNKSCKVIFLVESSHSIGLKFGSSASSSSNNNILSRAREVGASGVIAKDLSPSQVKEAIAGALVDEFYPESPEVGAPALAARGTVSTRRR